VAGIDQRVWNPPAAAQLRDAVAPALSNIVNRQRALGHAEHRDDPRGLHPPEYVGRLRCRDAGAAGSRLTGGDRHDPNAIDPRHVLRERLERAVSTWVEHPAVREAVESAWWRGGPNSALEPVESAAGPDLPEYRTETLLTRPQSTPVIVTAADHRRPTGGRCPGVSPGTEGRHPGDGD